MKANTEKRHGDVQIQKTNLKKIPAGWEPVPANPRGVVLAEGERTGHAHVLAAVATAFLYRKASEEYALLEVRERGHLDHEEHHRQVYEPGIYRVGVKRQYTEDEQGWAPVAD